MNPSSMLSKVLLARVKVGFIMLFWGRSFRLLKDPGWMCSKMLFEISIVFLALKKRRFLIALMFKCFYSKASSGDSIHVVGENQLSLQFISLGDFQYFPEIELKSFSFKDFAVDIINFS